MARISYDLRPCRGGGHSVNFGNSRSLVGGFSFGESTTLKCSGFSVSLDQSPVSEVPNASDFIRRNGNDLFSVRAELRRGVTIDGNERLAWRLDIPNSWRSSGRKCQDSGTVWTKPNRS